MGKHSGKKLNKKQIFLNMLIVIFIILLIASTVYITKWIRDNMANKKIADKVSEAIVEESGSEEAKYEVDFEKLKQINNQIVAYLKVNETNIEHAVVQAEDNEYYLRKDLEKKYNIGGSIFMDYKNKLDGTDKNIVIYGHNIKDGSMFGTLKNILNEEWYSNEENHIIDLITEQENQKYQVFSVYKIENEDYYINTDFEENEFKDFIQTLKNRSIKDFNIEITENDSILTLSTCGNSNKYRVVLHAKRIIE